MEKKINIAKLLKDCPQGMELDCTMFDKPVKYMELTKSGTYIITIKTSCGKVFYLTKEGYLYDMVDSKCVIFPKGKTTWEGFVPPCKFKDGDILTTNLGSIFILDNSQNTDISYGCFVGLGCDKTFRMSGDFAYKENCRLATEEERRQLLDAIKEHGYKWNAETKTLETLVEPKFKVGDKVKCIFNNFQYIITKLTNTHYTLVEVIDKFQYTEPIIEDKNWELVPNKFDINTLKPFDKVLVKDYITKKWIPDLFGCLRSDDDYPYEVIGGVYWRCCIPYEGNEHLLGKTDDCDEYYKTWED